MARTKLVARDADTLLPPDVLVSADPRRVHTDTGRGHAVRVNVVRRKSQADTPPTPNPLPATGGEETSK